MCVCVYIYIYFFLDTVTYIFSENRGEAGIEALTLARSRPRYDSGTHSPYIFPIQWEPMIYFEFFQPSNSYTMNIYIYIQ